MGDREVPYEAAEHCDVCGKRGAYDFMGDLYCGNCADKHLDMEDEDDQDLVRPPAETLPVGEIWYECVGDDIIQWEEDGSAQDDYAGHGKKVAEVANRDATNCLVYFANLGLKVEGYRA